MTADSTGKDRRLVTTTNPATGRPIAEYAAHTSGQLDDALDRAAAAAIAWGRLETGQRGGILLAVAALLRARREEYARLITAEMGKPLAEAAGEVDKCARNCVYVARHAESWLSDEPVEAAPGGSWVSYDPLGVVLAVMPWNFPFWQVLRFAAAALVAGNAALLKHSPNVTGCALAIEALFRDAGLPEGVFSTLVVAEPDVPAVIAGLVADARVSAVTLTGSDRAGAAIGEAAGRALKKSVLELGGSDPLVVLDDADLAAAADAAIQSRFGNAGQSCIAAKRLIVAEPVADQFVAMLAERAAALPVGDPSDPATRVGPLARPDLVAGLERQVADSVAAGAVVVAGGHRLDRPGSFYATTILDRVQPGMAVFAEETFGPVAAVVRARDDAHAVELANDTAYGLGAAVWSLSGRGMQAGRRIRSGALFVNAVVASDPRLPFGGTGRSGYGRELAAHGVREFTNVRTIWVGDPLTAAPAGVTEPAGLRMTKAAALDHVGISVADLDKAAAWYCGALGMRSEFSFTLPQFGFRAAVLAAPAGYRLELIERSGSAPGPAPADPVEAAAVRGFGHVCLDVPDVDAVYLSLVAAGASRRMPPRVSPEPGVRMAYVADPEGNLIELIDRTSARLRPRPDGPAGPHRPTT